MEWGEGPGKTALRAKGKGEKSQLMHKEKWKGEEPARTIEQRAFEKEKG